MIGIQCLLCDLFIGAPCIKHVFLFKGEPVKGRFNCFIYV